jgi:Uma2 family endonuclease
VAIESTELHRLSLDEYHQLIESGGFDESTRVELIDGLLVDKGVKTAEHENVIAWLGDELHTVIDRGQYQVRVSAALTLERSEPEPDLIVVERDAPRPYHPGTAKLVIEVAVSSQRRDLRTKPPIYARAGVPLYWVIDVDARRAVVHREPGPDGYANVEMLGAHDTLAAPDLGISISLADLFAAA